MKVGSVIGDPVIADGEVVRAVVGPGNTVAMETWRKGSWVPGGDPAATAFGRPLSAEELRTLGVPATPKSVYELKQVPRHNRKNHMEEPNQRGPELNQSVPPSPSLLNRVKTYWQQNLPKAYAKLPPGELEKGVQQAEEQLARLVSDKGLSLSGAREIVYPSLFPEPEGERDEEDQGLHE